MSDTWYNWYYYEPEMIDHAREQVEFFKERIDAINNKCNMNDKDKRDKIMKINLTIDALKYTYSLN